MLPTPEQVRLIVKESTKRIISTEQAKNYLDLFGAKLEWAILQETRRFITGHFGKAL
jgi:hypothetical protein